MRARSTAFRTIYPRPIEEAPWRAPDAVETIFANSGAEIRIGGPRAFYSTVTDHIQMPPAVAFHSPGAWSSVQIHEGIHWSGSKHRLNRDMSGRFGSKSYAREELVAELGQLNVCSTLGIADCDFVNGAAYLSHWLDILREDKREIFRVAADAQRAADFLLAFHPDYAARLKSPVRPASRAKLRWRNGNASQGRCLNRLSLSTPKRTTSGREAARVRATARRRNAMTNFDQEQALAEGWGVFEAGQSEDGSARIEIQRFDDAKDLRRRSQGLDPCGRPRSPGVSTPSRSRLNSSMPANAA